jgi:hypothetical protein
MELYGPDNDFGAPLFTDISDGDAIYSGNLDEGHYMIRVSRFDAAGTGEQEYGAYKVRVTNDNRVITIPAAPGGSVTADGNIEYDGDNDWFEFVLNSNTTLTFETENHSAGLAGGVRIYLYDNRGSEGAGRPGSRVRYSWIDATHPIPVNTYFLQSSPPHVYIHSGQIAINNIELTATAASPQRFWVRLRAEEQGETGAYILRVTR